MELPIDHIGLDETAILLTPNRNSSGPDEPLGSLVDVKYEKTQKMVEQWLEKAEEKALMRELDSALEFVMCAMRLIKEEGFGLDVLYKASRLLSFVYASQNEWKEAEQILDDLVDGDERARGRNAADTMYMLASNYFSNGNYEKATKWCWLALSWFKGTEKWNQQRIQLCYNLFAKINDIQGKSKEFNFWRSELDESFRKGISHGKMNSKCKSALTSKNTCPFQLIQIVKESQTSINAVNFYFKRLGKVAN